MYKIFNCKKGIAVDDLIPLLFTIIVFVFIILLLNASNISKKKDLNWDVKIKTSIPIAEQRLLNFLEKGVKVDDEIISISDMIKGYYQDQKYETILRQETEDMLKSLPKPAPVSGWNMYIYIMPEDKKIAEIEAYNIIGWYEKEAVFTYIPLHDDPAKYLKLKLSLECQC